MKLNYNKTTCMHNFTRKYLPISMTNGALYTQNMRNAENKELQLHLVPALLIYEIGRHVFVTEKWNTGNGSSCFVDIIRETVHMHRFMAE